MLATPCTAPGGQALAGALKKEGCLSSCRQVFTTPCWLWQVAPFLRSGLWIEGSPSIHRQVFTMPCWLLPVPVEHVWCAMSGYATTCTNF